MVWGWYGEWMTRWETDLTTRDTNRIVRPLEWGFDSLKDFGVDNLAVGGSGSSDFNRMIALNQQIVCHSDDFFGYKTPGDFRLEERHPELFPTNVRPETLARDAEMKRAAAEGELDPAQFLRFTSPVGTLHPENDQVNARWYPAPVRKQKANRPKQAIIVMPQWNADAISHNSLCTMFNRFGVSALRLSKPYHDIRRPAELERSDYAMSANVGRTLSACRQAIVDIRSCIDWLETQGYTQFGVLGTSLGSCYGFIAAAHDPRLRVCAFNHASTWFGDVVWEGQSTRHVRAGFEQAGLTQDQVRQLFLAISPMAYMDRFAATPKRCLVVHAKYDLTFPLHLSLDVLTNFRQRSIDLVSKVLPCGHYTTGETPFKYLDGWYLGSFVYQAFKRLAAEGTTGCFSER
ncbi:MAG TPA: alpha/beta hydrolase family protein [Acidobacteriaceae bacterium]|nr:alpha/beta hydrolase family protein [Acidobacteriaceae bacterium]